jgi:formylglycine-generating enzyme required for sulfatase activity
MQRTSEKQIPWTSSSMTGQFYFRLPSGNATVTPSAPSEIDLSAPTGGAGFDLGDLQQRAAQVEANKKAWAKKLAEMQAAFAQVQQFEGGGALPADKKIAWERFAAAFAVDNPYSSDDDTLRAKAGQRISHWEGQAAQVAMARPQPSNGTQPATSSVGGMQMILVKGGCFQMGSNDGDSDERPVHEVCLSDYYIGQYEVTVGQFREFVNAQGYRTDAERGGGCYYWTGSKWEMSRSKSWQAPGFEQTDNDPVACVSWNDAQEFIKWLNQKTGQRFRLPTEAEWEYAARSGGKSEKWAGTSSEASLGQYAWYDANAGGKTHPVGRKQANGLGLYDMSGNVWEWVQDWYGGYSGGRQSNPAGPASGEHRVLRGGSWSYNVDNVRASTRNRLNPGSGYDDVGFRCAGTP